MSDITVVIPTYNNASVLSSTLLSLQRVDYGNHIVEIVVVDNNSSDCTREVIAGFLDRMPLIYLFEHRPGKNCALNRALDEVSLGSIVFFTDDDVVFPHDFFDQVQKATERWPNRTVFGGKVYLIWPETDVPRWATDLSHQHKAYSKLDMGDVAKVLSSKCNPVGTCLWMSGRVFDSGLRYDESIGPRPKGTVMGSETSMLITLRKQGFQVVYEPSVVVGHRVPRKLLQPYPFLQRAFSSGRGAARLHVMETERVYDHPIPIWYLIRLTAVVKWCVLYLGTLFIPIEDLRIVRQWSPVQGIGWNLEMLRIALSSTGSRRPGGGNDQ